MKIIKMGLIIFPLLIFAAKSFASPSPCSGLDADYRDYREMPVGAECVTDKGGIFKRVSVKGNLGMQDMEADGKIWFDSIERQIFSYAPDICTSKGQQVPTKSDFATALERGLRQAFHDWNSRSDMDAKYFWTSTPYPSFTSHVVIVKIDYWQVFFNYTDMNSTEALYLRCIGNK